MIRFLDGKLVLNVVMTGINMRCKRSLLGERLSPAIRKQLGGLEKNQYRYVSNITIGIDHIYTISVYDIEVKTTYMPEQCQSNKLLRLHQEDLIILKREITQNECNLIACMNWQSDVAIKQGYCYHRMHQVKHASKREENVNTLHKTSLRSHLKYCVPLYV